MLICNQVLFPLWSPYPSMKKIGKKKNETTYEDKVNMNSTSAF